MKAPEEKFRLQPPAASCPRCGGSGRTPHNEGACVCALRSLNAQAPRNPLDDRATNALDEMARLNTEFNLRIVGSLRDWRPVGYDKHGSHGAVVKCELRGLFEEVGLLCTDGVAAFVLLPNGRPFFCHLANLVVPEKVRDGARKTKHKSQDDLLDLI